MKVKKTLLLFVKIAIVIAIFYYLYQGNYFDGIRLEQVFSPVYLAGGTILYSFAIAAQAFRWHLLLCLHHETARFRQTFKWALIGEFFSLAPIGIAGTDVSRAYFATKFFKEGVSKTISTVPVDRAIGLFGLLLLGAIPSLVILLDVDVYGANLKVLALAITVAVLALPIIWLCLTSGLILRTSFPDKLARMHQAFINVVHVYRSDWKTILVCIPISLTTHLLIFGMFYLAGLAMNQNIPPMITFFTTPLILTANSVPITPSGIGVGEAAAAHLLTQFGFAGGAVLMLVVRAWMICIKLLGGLVYFLLPAQNNTIARS